MCRGCVRLHLPAVFICICIISSAGQTLQEAHNALARQHYDRAEKLYRRISLREPGNLTALYFCAAVKQTRILDYESYDVDKEHFVKTADSVLTLLKRRETAYTGNELLD